MNISSSREFSHLSQPVQDLRPQYEAAVVDGCRLVWRSRTLIVAVTIGVMATALGIAALMKRTYSAEALIQMKFGNDGGATAAAATLVTVDGTALVDGEAEILRSRNLARRVLARLDRTSPPQPTASGSRPHDAADAPPPTAPPTPEEALTFDRRVMALQKGLTVKNDGKTYLIHVIYGAGDPARAALVANTFADEYLATRMEASIAAARRTSSWLRDQIFQASAEHQRAADQVRSFRERPDVIAADAGHDQVREQQMRDLVGQISAARLDTQRIEGRLKRLTEAAAAGLVPSSLDLQGASDAQKLIDAEVAARQEMARLGQILGTKHPLYVRSERAHAVAMQQVGDAVSAAAGIARTDLATARSTEAALAAQLAALRESTLSGQSADRTLRELEAKEATAQANLDRLREAFRQALAMADLKPIAAQIVGLAEPLSVPTSPNMTATAVLSGLGGLVAGVGLAFLLDRRDRGFSAGWQAAADLGVPCGGMIPARGTGDEPSDRRVYAQAVKALAINLDPHDAIGRGRVIVVTSAMPGEGKSDLVRDLAAALVGLDRRVLLVGGVGEAATARETDGVGDVGSARDGGTSAGSPADTRLTLHPRSGGDLVEVLGAGNRFKPWVEDARSQFDVVIVDAPAVLVSAEVLLMAQCADLVLFAVRWRSTAKRAALAALRQILPEQAQKAMVVITGVDLREHGRRGARDALYYADAVAER